MSKTSVQTFVIDLAERAGTGFLFGAAGAAAPILIGANTQNVVDVHWYMELLAVALAGGVSALGSVIKGIVAGVRTGTASLSKQVAATAVIPGAHSTDLIEAVSGVSLQAAPVAAPAVTPLDNPIAAADAVYPTAPPAEAPATA